MTIVETRSITGGVDTHLDVHVAAALDGNGGVLGVESFPTTTAGFAELHAWLVLVRHAGPGRGGGHGRLRSRAGPLLTRDERGGDRGRSPEPSGPAGPRQVRRHRCRGGRSSGAVAAGRRLWPRPPMATSRRSGCCSSPTAPDATCASNVSTSCAISASAGPMSCGNGSAALPSTSSLRPPPALRPNRNGDPVLYATKLAMQTLGRRVVDIDADCARLHSELADLVKATAPSLLDLSGVGIHTAALLLVAAGDNAERITSEAAFAHLCGVAPIHASSGKTVRHRLNRGGNRQANHALWRIVFTRMSSDPRTRTYVERRTPRRPLQTRDHARPQALRRPPGVSPPPRRVAPRSEWRVWPPKCQHAPPGCPANDLPARHSTARSRHRLA